MINTDRFFRSIGAALQRIRESAGISRETLQMKSGIHRNTIARYENGEANPNLKTLIMLTNALGYEVKVSFAKRKVAPKDFGKNFSTKEEAEAALRKENLLEEDSGTV